MGILSQTTQVDAVLSETDMTAEFSELTKELNVLGHQVRKTKVNIGTFDSRLLDENGEPYEITLYIGAKIAKKEVEDEN